MKKQIKDFFIKLGTDIQQNPVVMITGGVVGFLVGLCV